MSVDRGDWAVGSVIDHKWDTNAVDGSSITRSTDGTLKIYKDNSLTERTSLAGVTQTEDFDGNVGNHHIRIDTSDNTDAGFYAAGHAYQVVETSMTIDGKSVNHTIFHFTIEKPDGVLDILFDGIVRGIVGPSPAPTTGGLTASSLNPAPTVNDQLKGSVLVFTRTTATAALRGQRTNVLSSTSGGALTYETLTSTPASGDEFRLY